MRIPSFVTYWAVCDLAARFAAPIYYSRDDVRGERLISGRFVTLLLPAPAQHFVTAEADLQEVVNSFVT